MPLARCIATDPSFSSPIDGRERVRAGEPFSLGLRRDADEALILGEPLGRGAMGVVRVATRKSDGCKFALKTIPKAGPQSLSGQTPTGEAMSIWERKVRDEVSLHFALGASLDIVTLHDGFEDEAGVHLLIDLCDGGDLLSGASVAHSTEDEDNAVRVPEDDDLRVRGQSTQLLTPEIVFLRTPGNLFERLDNSLLGAVQRVNAVPCKRVPVENEVDPHHRSGQRTVR